MSMPNLTVFLWFVDVDQLIQRNWPTNGPVEDWGEYLSRDEIDRGKRYRFDQLRNRFLAGRCFLRSILGLHTGQPPKKIAFTSQINGKPQISYPTTNLQFSFSRSGRYAACGVCQSQSVGLDIEQHKSMDDMDSVAASIFSPAEFQQWDGQTSPERQATFFQSWARKEAKAKVDGSGITAGPEKIIVPINKLKRSTAVVVPPEGMTQVLLSDWQPVASLAAAVAIENNSAPNTSFSFQDQLVLDIEGHQSVETWFPPPRFAQPPGVQLTVRTFEVHVESN